MNCSVKVTEEVVQGIARLARLDVDPSELGHMTRELNQIIAFIRDLDGVDTDRADAESHVSRRPAPLRSDIPAVFPHSSLILETAPVEESGFFSVPGVVKHHES